MEGAIVRKLIEELAAEADRLLEELNGFTRIALTQQAHRQIRQGLSEAPRDVQRLELALATRGAARGAAAELPPDGEGLPMAIEARHHVVLDFMAHVTEGGEHGSEVALGCRVVGKVVGPPPGDRVGVEILLHRFLGGAEPAKSVAESHAGHEFRCLGRSRAIQGRGKFSEGFQARLEERFLEVLRARGLLELGLDFVNDSLDQQQPVACALGGKRFVGFRFELGVVGRFLRRDRFLPRLIDHDRRCG